MWPIHYVSYSVQHACMHAYTHTMIMGFTRKNYTLLRKNKKKKISSSTQPVFMMAQKQLFQHLNLACVQMPRIYCKVTFSKAGGRMGRLETRVNLSLCAAQRLCTMALYMYTFQCTLVYMRCSGVKVSANKTNITNNTHLFY